MQPFLGFKHLSYIDVNVNMLGKFFDVYVNCWLYPFPTFALVGYLLLTFWVLPSDQTSHTPIKRTLAERRDQGPLMALGATQTRGLGMSKTGSPTPWSIKGIGPEAREAAKAAAKREGMTLGAWLSERVIAESKGGGSESAQETTGETTAGVVAPDIILAALHDHLSGLNDRLDGMAAEVSRVSGAVDQAG